MLSETRLGKEAHAAILARPRENLAVIALCVVAFIFPTVAVDYRGELWRHAVSLVSHANIFHLMANMYCVWLMRFKADWLWAFAIGFIATFIPSPVWSWKEMGFTLMPTCGASGVILAAVAMRYAEASAFKMMLKWLVLPILPLTLVPNINTPLHIYCIIIGYFCKYIQK